MLHEFSLLSIATATSNLRRFPFIDFRSCRSQSHLQNSAMYMRVIYEKLIFSFFLHFNRPLKSTLPKKSAMKEAQQCHFFPRQNVSNRVSSIYAILCIYFAFLRQSLN